MRFQTLNEWLGWLEDNHPKEIDLGLRRVKRVALSLGLVVPASDSPASLADGPQTASCPQAPITITVAGTNGKGSCVAVLEQVLLAQGRSVGVYTSPHFMHYCERIRVDGIPVSEEEVCAAFACIDQARGDVSLTYFEFGTLAALVIFRQRGVAIQVLEVGLGGRLDAVNLVAADVAVVTSIAIDHEDWLGSDREVIGREKAGVFRGGCPAICADPQPPKSIAAVADELGARLLQVGKTWQFSVLPEQNSWEFEGRTAEDSVYQLSTLPIPALPLPSAAAALQALLCLGIEPAAEIVAKSLADVALPGRFQKCRYRGRELILDVAHNPAAAAYLAERLAASNSGQTRAIVAMMGDKDRIGSFRALAPVVDRWSVAGLSFLPRAATTAELQSDLQHLDITAEAYDTVAEALESAVSETVPQDRILVVGSFFTVAEALKVIEGKNGSK